MATDSRRGTRNQHWSPSRSGTPTTMQLSRKFPNATLKPPRPEMVVDTVQERQSNDPEEMARFWEQLVKDREVERKNAIAQGKMDDPLVAKRLEDAITIEGTCTDMCPRFERYRRERENGLTSIEMIPGTRLVDHKRAVKIYERAAGDKILPSDLRPPQVLKETLDYLFHTVLLEEDFLRWFTFIRDRSRAVRNDFTIQRNNGPLAIACHDRCTRFHILALMLVPEPAMEETAIMNTLQSLKEFYSDQRQVYTSPTELEMRVYHRLIHIRDQRERAEDVPEYIASNRVYMMTSEFRKHVQKCSEPIRKTSQLKVDEPGMRLFGELVGEVMAIESGIGSPRGMVYLLACILEHHFGKGAVPRMEQLKEGLRWRDIIDGVDPEGLTGVESSGIIQEVEEEEEGQAEEESEEFDDSEIQDGEDYDDEEEIENDEAAPTTSAFAAASAFPSSGAFPSTSAFPTSSPFPSTSAFSSSGTNPFANLKTTPNAFGANTPTLSFPPSSSTPSTTSFFGNGNSSAFGATSAPASAFTPPVPMVVAPAPVQLQPTTVPSNQTHLFTKPTVSSPLASSPPLVAPQAKLPSTQPDFFANSRTGIFASIKPQPAPLQFPKLPLQFPSSAPTLAVQTPPLPRIDTNVENSHTTPTNGILPSSNTLDSPRVPPVLPKHQPISLPHTPGTSTSNGDPEKPKTTAHRPSVIKTSFPPPLKISFPPPLKTAFPQSPFKSSMLSPLVLNSPTVSGSARRYSASVVSGDDKSDQEEEASVSAEFPPSASTARLTKTKRRKETPSSGASRTTKRMKKQREQQIRMSAEGPRTDEDLARRLLRNEEEHMRYWASGTFLHTLQSHFKAHHEHSDDEQDDWRIWLSMNPVVDSTAIWLETKFDVQAENGSGEWLSDIVFSIPAREKEGSSSTNTVSSSSSPGIIVFECTPLESVTDELDRKFYVLDDCARLRDLVQSLPPRRAYAPCLLLIHWSGVDLSSDITDMVNKLIQNKTLKSFRVFSQTSKSRDSDAKFQAAVNALDLDYTGTLVMRLPLSGVFKLHNELLQEFINDWIARCSDEDFDWSLYSRLVNGIVVLLTSISQSVLELIGVLPLFAPLPSSFNSHLNTQLSTYDGTIAWLDTIHCAAADSIAQDLTVYRDLGRDFPTRNFLNQLYDLAVHQTVSYLRGQQKDHDGDVHVVLKVQVESSLDAFENAIASQAQKLVQAQSFIRSSSKRRDRSISSSSFGVDESWSSHSSKRAKFNSSTASEATSTPNSPPPQMNGRASPSSSASNVDTDMASNADTDLDGFQSSSVVTIAMLRALTKNLKEKYKKG